MSRPNASYPQSIWDGSSANRQRIQGGLLGPDHRDWDRITSEMIAVQNMLGVNGTGFGVNVEIVTGDVAVTAFRPTLFSVDTDSQDISLTLGDPATYVSAEYTFIKTKVANAMTIIGTVSGTVNPIITVQYTSMTVVSDGVEWLIK